MTYRPWLLSGMHRGTKKLIRITRRLDSDFFDGPVVATSVYRRQSPDPRWNIYGGDTRLGP